MTARSMILAAGLLAGFASPCWATDDIPVRGNWVWQLGWRHWPAVMPSYNVAPWYLWWPADATESLGTTNFQSSPYPTYQAPPAARQAPRPMQRPVGQMTQSPYGYPMQQIPPQPTHYPASYPPSYSYGR